jgi:hypothetical protein
LRVKYYLKKWEYSEILEGVTKLMLAGCRDIGSPETIKNSQAIIGNDKEISQMRVHCKHEHSLLKA